MWSIAQPTDRPESAATGAAPSTQGNGSIALDERAALESALAELRSRVNLRSLRHGKAGLEAQMPRFTTPG